MNYYVETSKKIIRGILLVIAIVLIVLGIIHGDFYDVMNKAIYLCYECIGIG